MAETLTATTEKKSLPHAQRQYTTSTELEEYQDLVDKVFVRRPPTKDKTLFRVVHMFPQFKQATGEDQVNITDPITGEIKYGDDDKPITGYNYLVQLSIENFTEEIQGKGDKRTKTKIVIGTFNQLARDFVDKFDERD